MMGQWWGKDWKMMGKLWENDGAMSRAMTGK